MARHARKLVTRWLSMRGNWLIVGCKARKLVTHWLSMREKLVTRKLSIRENHFGALRAFSEFFLSSSCHPFLCLLLPLSPLSFLCTLFYISFSLCSINEYIGTTNSTYVHILGPLCKLAKSLQGVGRRGGEGRGGGVMAVLYSWPNPPAGINIAHIRRMGRGNTEPVNDEVFIQLRRKF